MFDACGSDIHRGNSEVPALWVVVPCHNEEKSLPLLVDELRHQRADLAVTADLKLLLVDDGSSDGTLEAMRQAHCADSWVHYLALSRNFGKEAALYAGIDRSLAAGACYVAVMDADLQDPPQLLGPMLDLVIRGGYSVAAARRVSREGEPPVRSLFAKAFYRLMDRVGDVPIPDGARDFRVMDRLVAEAVVSMPERTRFSKGLFAWVGFPVAWVEYEHVERAAGSTSWSFWGLVRYAVEGVISFSTAPLKAISALGLIVFVLAMAFLVFVLVRAAAFGDPVAGWPSLAALITAFAGLQILCLGVIGLCVARIYTEAKHRPIYLVREEA